MKTRAPIHLGSGEPVLLLHPFLISQLVWEDVAQQLADTGRYEVFAPTMAGHNGGPASGTWFLSSAVLADHVERQLDELGWDTAHIVGNSLGGWVAFELERRGRARTVTGIAPADADHLDRCGEAHPEAPAGRRRNSRWSPSSSRGCRSGCSPVYSGTAP